MLVGKRVLQCLEFSSSNTILLHGVLVVLNVGPYLHWKRGEGVRERERGGRKERGRVKGMEGGRGWCEENIDSCSCVMSK